MKPVAPMPPSFEKLFKEVNELLNIRDLEERTSALSNQLTLLARVEEQIKGHLKLCLRRANKPGEYPIPVEMRKCFLRASLPKKDQTFVSWILLHTGQILQDKDFNLVSVARNSRHISLAFTNQQGHEQLNWLMASPEQSWYSVDGRAVEVIAIEYDSDGHEQSRIKIFTLNCLVQYANNLN